MRRLTFFLGAALVLSACEDATSPEVADDEPRFAQIDAEDSAAVTEASFWAVRGEMRTLELENSDGSTALEFVVGANSLVARPDGTPFAEGDSIRITVERVSTGQYIFDFQPSGLQFSTNDPALLRMHYDADLNGDGLLDLADVLLQSTLSIWMQAAPGLPWLPIPSVRLPGQVVEGQVTHFTGFALAS